MKIFIKLNYFNKFGGNQKLLNIYEEFSTGKNKYGKNLKESTKQNRINELKEFEKQAKNTMLSIKEQLGFELEVLGNPISVFQVPKGTGYALEVDISYSPKIRIYGLLNGKILDMKIDKKTFNKNKIAQFEFIRIIKHNCKPKYRKNGENFEPIPNTQEWWIEEYEKINL
jgi:DNA polymerase-3 subunit alpha